MKLFSYTSIVSALTFLVVVSSNSQQTWNHNEISEILTTSQTLNDFETNIISLNINTDKTNEELHISGNTNDLQYIENVDESIVTQEESVISEKAISITNQKENTYSELQSNYLDIDIRSSQESIDNSITSSLTKENYNSLTMQSNTIIDDGQYNEDGMLNTNINSVSIVGQTQNSQTGINTDLNYDSSNTMNNQPNEGLNNIEKSTKNYGNQNTRDNLINIQFPSSDYNMRLPSPENHQNMYTLNPKLDYLGSNLNSGYPLTPSSEPNIDSEISDSEAGPSRNISPSNGFNMQYPSSENEQNTYTPKPKLDYLGSNLNTGYPLTPSSEPNMDSEISDSEGGPSRNISPSNGFNMQYPSSKNEQNTYTPNPKLDYPGSNLNTGYPLTPSSEPNINSEISDSEGGPSRNISPSNGFNMQYPSSENEQNTYTPNPKLDYLGSNLNTGYPLAPTSEPNVDSEGGPSKNISPSNGFNMQYTSLKNEQNTYTPNPKLDYLGYNLNTGYPLAPSSEPNLDSVISDSEGGPYRNISPSNGYNMQYPSSENEQNTYTPNTKLDYLGSNLNTGYPLAPTSEPNIDSEISDSEGGPSKNISPSNGFNTQYPSSENEQNTYTPNPKFDYLGYNLNTGYPLAPSSEPNLVSEISDSGGGPSKNISPSHGFNMQYPSSENEQNTYTPNTKLDYLGSNLNTGYPLAPTSEPNIDSEISDSEGGPSRDISPSNGFNMQYPSSENEQNTYTPNPKLDYLGSNLNTGYPLAPTSEPNVDSEGGPSKNISPSNGFNMQYPSSENEQNTYTPNPKLDYLGYNLNTGYPLAPSSEPNLDSEISDSGGGPSSNIPPSNGYNMQYPSSENEQNTYTPNTKLDYLGSNLNTGYPLAPTSEPNVDSEGGPSKNISPSHGFNMQYPSSENEQNTYTPNPKLDYLGYNLNTGYPLAPTSEPNIDSEISDSEGGPSRNISPSNGFNMQYPSSENEQNTYTPNPKLDYLGSNLNTGYPLAPTSEPNVDSEGGPSKNISPSNGFNMQYPSSENEQNTYTPNPKLDYLGYNLNTGYPLAPSSEPNLDSEISDSGGGPSSNISPSNGYNMQYPSSENEQNTYTPNTKLDYLGSNLNTGYPLAPTSEPNIDSEISDSEGGPSKNISPSNGFNTQYPSSENEQNTYTPNPKFDYLGYNLNTGYPLAPSSEPNLVSEISDSGGGPSKNISPSHGFNMQYPSSENEQNTYTPNPKLDYLGYNLNTGYPLAPTSEPNIDSEISDSEGGPSRNISPSNGFNMQYPSSENEQNTYTPNPKLDYLGSNLNTGYPLAPTSEPNVDSEGGPSKNISPSNGFNMQYPSSENEQNTYTPNPKLDYLGYNLNTGYPLAPSSEPNLDSEISDSEGGPSSNISPSNGYNMQYPSSENEQNTYTPNTKLDYLGSNLNTGYPLAPTSEPNIDSENLNGLDGPPRNIFSINDNNMQYPSPENYYNALSPIDSDIRSQQYSTSSLASVINIDSDSRNSGNYYLSDIDLENPRKQNYDTNTNLYVDHNPIVTSDIMHTNMISDRDVQISNDNIEYQGEYSYNQFLSNSLTGYEQTESVFETSYIGDNLLEDSYISSLTYGNREFSLDLSGYEHDQAMEKSESQILHTDISQQSSDLSILKEVYNSFSNFGGDTRSYEIINQNTENIYEQSGNGYVQSVNNLSGNNVDNSNKLSYNFNVPSNDQPVAMVDAINSFNVNNVSDDLDQLGRDIKGVTNGVLNKFEDTTGNMYDSVRSVTVDAENSVKRGITDAVNYVGNNAANIYDDTDSPVSPSRNISPSNGFNMQYPISENEQNTYTPNPKLDYFGSNLNTRYQLTPTSEPNIDSEGGPSRNTSPSNGYNMQYPISENEQNTYTPNPKLDYLGSNLNTGYPLTPSSEPNLDSEISDSKSGSSRNISPSNGYNMQYPSSENEQNTYTPNPKLDYLGSNLNTGYPLTPSSEPNIDSEISDSEGGPSKNISPSNGFNTQYPSSENEQNTYTPNPKLDYLGSNLNTGYPLAPTSEPNIDSENLNGLDGPPRNTFSINDNNMQYPSPENYYNALSPIDSDIRSQQYSTSSLASVLNIDTDSRNSGNYYLSDIDLENPRKQNYDTNTNLYVDHNPIVTSDIMHTNMISDRDVQISNDNIEYQGEYSYNQFLSNSLTGYEQTESVFETSYIGDNLLEDSYISSLTYGNREFSLDLSGYEHDQAMEKSESQILHTDISQQSSDLSVLKEVYNSYTSFGGDTRSYEIINQNTENIYEESGNGYVQSVNNLSGNNVDNSNKLSYNFNVPSNDQPVAMVDAINSFNVNNVSDDLDQLGRDIKGVTNGVLNKFEDTTGNIYDSVRSASVDAANSFKQGTADAINYVGNNAADIYNDTNDVVNAVQQDASDTLNEVGDTTKNIYNASKDAVEDATGAIKQGTADAVNYVGNNAADIYNDTKDVVNAVQQDASYALNEVGETTKNIYNASKDAAKDATGTIKQGTADAVNYVGNNAADIYNDTKDVVNAVQQDASNALNEVGETTKNIYNASKDAVKDATGAIKQGTADAVNYVGNNAADIYNDTKDVVNAVQQDASNALNEVGETTKNIYNASKDAVKDATGAIKQGTADAVNYVGSNAADIYNDTKDVVNGVQQDASNALNEVGDSTKNIYNASKDAAKDATGAIKQGTADAINYVGSNAVDIYNDTKDAVNVVQQDASNALNEVGDKTENVYDASKKAGKQINQAVNDFGNSIISGDE